MTNVAIIGGGPSGCMCAITAKRHNPELNITIFEKNDVLRTLFYTGGGRCNITHQATNDFREFAQNYPRGEKFLYSVFSQFFVQDTLDFFNSIGIKTYSQEDGRFFPVSDKSSDVIKALKNEMRYLNINIKNEIVENINYNNNKFQINNETFDKLVISTGGKNCKLLSSISESGHNILEMKPSLSSLEIKEKYYNKVSGVSLKNITATVNFGKKKINLKEDLLFTHKGISGPLAYKISSLFATENYCEENPIVISLKFGDTLSQNYGNKELLTVLSGFMPKSLATILLEENQLPLDKKFHQLSKNEHIKLSEIINCTKLTVIAPLKDGEIVSAGGIDLKEINPKTMMSKIINNLYFCGEVINIDGFCGGYNLQNCWSTGFVAGMGIAD